MRPIPPTLKDTPRYAFVPDTSRSDYARIEERFAHLFGVFGLAKARLRLVEVKRGLVIRVENTSLDELRATLTTLPPMRIERVSGTLEKLRTNYLKQPSSRDANEREDGR